jgi:hypothetical protein
MKPEKPVCGILKQSDYGDSIWYHVECECMDPDHCHVVEVEASPETCDVLVHLYTDVSTPFWSKSRWKMIWEILTIGRAKHQACIILRPQSAVNYSAALKEASKQVQLYKDQK